MTKRIKISLMAILTALMLLCIGMASMGGIQAKALDNVEGHQTHGLSTKSFAFKNTGKIGLEETADGFLMKDELGFTLSLLDPEQENLLEYGEPNRIEWWGGNNKTFFAYTFTAYRMNKDGITAVPLKSYMIVFDYCDGNSGEKCLRRTVAEKQLSYCNEEMFFSYGLTIGSSNSVPGERASAYIEANKYKIIESFKFNGDDVGEYLGSRCGLNTVESISIGVDSYYTDYFVEFNYHYEILGFSGIFATNYDVTEGTIDGPIRSFYSYFQKADEAGALEGHIFEEQGREILENGSFQNVKIKYLEQIEGTPFAKMIERRVDVPVIDSVVRVRDVCVALEVDTIDCLGSNCLSFKYDATTDTYVAYYLKNVWLRSITTDGKYMDYYLDINLSYQDYYYQFVEDGVFTNDLYEWIFSTQMMTKYPALKGYLYSEVYGYFGMAVVPNTHTLDSAFATMFDIDVSQTGIIKSFSFDQNLSFDAYQKLLSDYQYSWLSKVWEGVWGTVTGDTSATHYLFFSEPGVDRGHIGEGGQEDGEDTSGVVGGAIEEVGGVVGGLLGSAWQGVTSLIAGIGGFLSSGGGIITIVLIIVGAVVLVKIINRKKK